MRGRPGLTRLPDGRYHLRMSAPSRSRRPRRRSLAAQPLWQGAVTVVATIYVAVLPVDLVLGFPVGYPVGLIRWLAPLVFFIDLATTAKALVGLERRQPSGLPMAVDRVRSILVADGLAVLCVLAPVGPPALGLFALAKLGKIAAYMSLWRRRYLRHSSRLLLVYTTYWLMLWGHWISCGWLALREPDPSAATITVYVDAVYWTITTLTAVGYGDITPDDLVEKLFAIATMVTGLAFLGYIIGIVANALRERDPAAVRFASNVDQLAQAARHWNLPRPLQDRIYDYHWYVWQQRLGHDEADFLRTLPEALRGEVSLHIKSEVLENVELFRGTDRHFLRDVAIRLQPRVLVPGERVIEAGDEGQEMFFVVRGELDVVLTDGSSVSGLGDGDFFGEIALFTDEPRTATVVARTYCDVFVLSRSAFTYIARKYPEINARVESEALVRAARTAQAEGDG